MRRIQLAVDDLEFRGGSGRVGKAYRHIFPRRPQSRWASWSEEETEEGNKMKNWDACVFGVGELSVDRV
jgi:hypothetical protein